MFLAYESTNEKVIPRYTDLQFRHHSRMSRPTVEQLCLLLGNCPQVLNGFNYITGRPPIQHRKQVLVCLWYLGNNKPYDLTAEKFDIGTSTTFCITRHLSVALVEIYNETYIKWPKEEKLEEVMNQFEAKKGFPGVIGAVGGCHIPIICIKLLDKTQMNTLTESDFIQSTYKPSPIMTY